jgi:hypothetical protein
MTAAATSKVIILAFDAVTGFTDGSDKLSGDGVVSSSCVKAILAVGSYSILVAALKYRLKLMVFPLISWV